MNKYVSIDIGGTAIKYGIIYEDAEIICKRSMKTEAWKGGPAILQKVTGIVEEMKQEAQKEISGICISTAGMVDTKEGSIFYSAPLIPNYAGTQFFTKEEDGYFKQHESLETARDYIIHEYGADVEIETETDIRFTY